MPTAQLMQALTSDLPGAGGSRPKRSGPTGPTTAQRRPARRSGPGRGPTWSPRQPRPCPQSCGATCSRPWRSTTPCRACWPPAAPSRPPAWCARYWAPRCSAPVSPVHARELHAAGMPGCHEHQPCMPDNLDLGLGMKWVLWPDAYPAKGPGWHLGSWNVLEHHVTARSAAGRTWGQQVSLTRCPATIPLLMVPSLWGGDKQSLDV